MVDTSRVITYAATKIGKEGADKIVSKAQELVESAKKGTILKKASDLLEKKKQTIKVKLGDKTTTTAPGKEATIKVSQKEFEVKQPKVDVKKADEALFKYKGTVITPKILDDFNINKFSSQKDFIKFIDIISKQGKAAFDKQKRKVQTHEQTKLLATWLQKNPENTLGVLLNLKPGQTLNAQWIFAARELLEAGSVKLDDLATKAISGNLDDVLKFRQHFALMSQFQKILKGVQTETARALNQYKIPTRSKKFASIDLDDLNKQNLILELGGEEDIRAVATLYINSGSTHAKNKLVSEVGMMANLRKASDSIAEIYLNAILSSPITHVRNIGGNWITMGINNFERKRAARWFGGKEIGGIAEYEDVAKVFGKKMASEEMLQAIATAFRQKGFAKFFKEFDQSIASNFGNTSKVELRPGRFTSQNFDIGNKKVAAGVDFVGQFLTLGRVPTRFLTVMDNWFKNQEFRSELYAVAYRETLEMYNQGWLRRNNMEAYLADRIVNPTKAMKKAAWDAAHYVTYQTQMTKAGGKLQQFGHHLQGMKNKSGFMSWFANYYLPFVRTPTNIATFVSERTPGLAQLLTRYNTEITSGNAARVQMAKTRLYLGSLFYSVFAGAGFMGYAGGSDINLKGKYTGSKTQMLKLFGYQPNTIRIPVGDGKHYQINTTGFDPFNMMISMAANSGQFGNLLLQDHDEMPEDYLAHTLALTLGFGEVLSNSTFLMGVSNMTKDIQNAGKAFSGDVDGGQWGKKWWNRFSSSFIPTGFKWMGKNIPVTEDGKLTWFNDDFNKLAVETQEYYLRNINEKHLEYDYNILGEKIEKFGFLSSYTIGPVHKAIMDVNPKLQPFERGVSFPFSGLSVNVPLKSNELRFWKRNAGELFKTKMEEAMENDVLFKDPNTEVIVKEAIIKKLLGQARSEVKRDLLSPTFINEKGETVDNEMYHDIFARASELKDKKILTRQGGKPIIEDNLGYIGKDAEELWSNQ